MVAVSVLSVCGNVGSHLRRIHLDPQEEVAFPGGRDGGGDGFGIVRVLGNDGGGGGYVLPGFEVGRGLEDVDEIGLGAGVGDVDGVGGEGEFGGGFGAGGDGGGVCAKGVFEQVGEAVFVGVCSGVGGGDVDSYGSGAAECASEF